MLLRFDPFRDFDRLAGEMFGTAHTPAPMPMDCLRTGDRFLVRFDLPGIDADSLEVSAENNTLTVRAERRRRDPDDATYWCRSAPRAATAGSWCWATAWPSTTSRPTTATGC
jgi:HSP20 family protein